MAAATPIGRERELEQLLEVAKRMRGGHGSVVFLAGSTGSGKSVLLKAFTEVLAAEEDDRVEVVSAVCYGTSAGNPLGPFGEVLRALTSKERRGDRAKRVLQLVGQVAPPLVELIGMLATLTPIAFRRKSIRFACSCCAAGMKC